MADKPIIFSGPMIRALLDGRKTQTRRKLRVPPPFDTADDIDAPIASGFIEPQYRRGDRLWVRENCATWEGGHRDIVYRSDLSDKEWSYLLHDARNGAPWKRRPSIHMPRWASRLTLTVTDVRVQRVQEISGRDVIAEGVRCEGCHDVGTGDYSACRDGGCFAVRNDFRDLWNSLHGPDAWAKNPWVCALTFDVHRCNIDQIDGGGGN